MTALLVSATRLRQADLSRVLPIAIGNMLILSTLYLLKPVRNALFLSQLGAKELPWVLLLVALVGAITALTLTRATQRTSVERLVRYSLPFFALNLAGFWFVLDEPSGPLVFLFYVWVNLYGHLVTSLLWLLAGTTFNVREARRVFGFIGASGILGAVFGGGLAQLALYVGTKNLLWLAIFELALAFLVLRRIPLGAEGADRAPRRAKRSLASDWAKTPLLRVLIPMGLVAAFVPTIVDIQFNFVVEEAFAGSDEKTAFFGAFFAALNVFAFGFQLFFTPRVLQRYGLLVALTTLPVALFFGSGMLLLAPTLWSAALLKGADGGFRHSIDKSALELLFVPLPTATRKRAKVFQDVTVENVGTGLGALVVLGLTASLGVAYPTLSALSLVACAGWVALAVRAHRAYVDSFRSALARRELDPTALAVDITDAQALEHVRAALASGNERQILYGLELLGERRQEAGLVESLGALLGHSSSEVRAKALRALAIQGTNAFVEERASALLQDPESQVRQAAVRALVLQQPRKAQAVLEQYLEHEDVGVRSAALGCLASDFERLAGSLLSESRIRHWLEETGVPGVRGRTELGRALRGLSPEAARPWLEALSHDDSDAVVAQTMLTYGAHRDVQALDWLIENLGRRSLRGIAISALVSYGDLAVPALRAAVVRRDYGPTVRAGASRTLGRIPTQLAVDALLEVLSDVGLGLRIQVLKALNRQRLSRERLRFERGTVRELLNAELVWYDELGALERAQPTMRDEAQDLLLRAISEKRVESLDRAFRLLALYYPPRDIYNAFLGIRSQRPRVQANAIEFLDYVLEPEDKRSVLPLVEPAAEPPSTRTPAPSDFGFARLVRARDPWLRACAVFGLGPRFVTQYDELWQQLRTDRDPVVLEALGAVERRTGLVAEGAC